MWDIWKRNRGFALLRLRMALLIGTGNTGKLVSFGAQETHEYVSDVLDAGALARFGRVEVEPGSNGYELLTRTGNVEQPVRGWTDWEPLKADSVGSPAGRFLQWKAVLHAGGVVGSVGVNYLPVNAAPVVDEVVVVPGARLNAQPQATQPQTVNISLPSSSQGATVTFDGSANVVPRSKTGRPLRRAGRRTTTTATTWCSRSTCAAMASTCGGC